MMAIFHDMIEKTMEVFMDDFLVFGDSFDLCLSILEKMLKRCEDMNLVLNWEKCHFMCREGIVLGHKISKSGIEVDHAKVEVISKLPYPTTVKGVRSFLVFRGLVRFRTNANGEALGAYTIMLVRHDESFNSIPTLGKEIACLLITGASTYLSSLIKLTRISLIYKRGREASRLKNSLVRTFTIIKLCFLYGTIELSQPDGPNFKVNGHRVKHYFEGDLPPKVVQDLHTFLRMNEFWDRVKLCDSVTKNKALRGRHPMLILLSSFLFIL
ncbi:reverse transcriptase domain-containing protein [Tanacetum coccineum]